MIDTLNYQYHVIFQQYYNKLLIYKNNNIINLTFKIIESIQIEKTTILFLMKEIERI